MNCPETFYTFCHYDTKGRVSRQIVARTANGVRHTYEYDGRGQLLTVRNADGSDAERYAYDKAWNMIRKTVGGVTTTFTFDRANQLVSSARRGLFPSALWSVSTEFMSKFAERL